MELLRKPLNFLVECYKEDAQKVFDVMPERNVVSWNAMIAAYTQSGQRKRAFQLFQDMQRDGILTSSCSFLTILDACGSKETLSEGKHLHIRIVGNRFESELVVSNALINMYGKCCSPNDARKWFYTMPEWNDVSWNSLITVFADNDLGKEASDLFNQMLHEGWMPTKVTYVAVINALVSAVDLPKVKQLHALIVGSSFKSETVVENALLNLYCKCGRMDIAMEIFETLDEHCVITWTAMIAGYTQVGKCKEAFLTFNQMYYQEGVMPNEITFISILAACSTLSALAEGKRVHAVIMSHGLELKPVIGNALVDMYAKCGSLQDAHHIFNLMPEQDTVTWTAMIAAHAQHGQIKETLKLFYEMQGKGVRPNKVTFLIILSACNHTGLVEEGHHWFVTMQSRYGITPTDDHYNCIIDLFGRAGRLDEAEELVMNTPEKTIVALMALLTACKYQADIGRAERIAKHVHTLFPKNFEPYVTLANIYAAAGREDDAEKVFSSLGLRD